MGLHLNDWVRNTEPPVQRDKRVQEQDHAVSTLVVDCRWHDDRLSGPRRVGGQLNVRTRIKGHPEPGSEY